MGFFSTKNDPHGPIPNIAIYLASQQDTVFKPNDIISGHVSLSTPAPITPQALEVSLFGESKVWIRTQSSNSSNDSTNYTHYRDLAPLFAVTSNLLPKPQMLSPNQTYNLPFSFRMPEGTGNTRADCYKNPADERWTVLPHLLPPTFFFGRKPDMPDNASISYGILVRYICPGVGIGDDLEPVSATVPILFQPLNPNAGLPGPVAVLRYPKRFTLQSSTLAGLDPSSIGFRKRISDRFSSGTPKLDFELGAEMPELLTSGSPFRFRLSFTAIDRSEKVVVIPAITFRILKLELLDFTFFRAPRDWSAMDTMAGTSWKHGNKVHNPVGSMWEQTIYREKKTLLNSIPESQTIELPETQVMEKKEMQQASYCEHWFEARVPGFTPPTFTTFAIARMYRVKMKVQVGIGGQKFETEVESHVRHLGSV